MIAGTSFRLVEMADVWPKYAERARKSRAPASALEWLVGQCHNREAVCLECEDGIVVLMLVRIDETLTRAKVLLAVSLSAPGALARRLGEFVTVVRDIGASELSFRSDRPRAWRRILGPGWQTDGSRFWRPV